MKAITIKQPWAIFICDGYKDVENRTWKTNFRGRVLVHAGLDRKLKPSLNREQNNALYKHYQKTGTQPKAYGCIIGSVEIIDCVINHPSIWAEKSKVISKPNKKDYYIGGNWVEYNMISYQRDLKEWEENKPIWNWVLANPVLFPEPVKAKGKLSFWDFPGIDSEEDDLTGNKICLCSLPVPIESQVQDLAGELRCRYCGGIWYR